MMGPQADPAAEGKHPLCQAWNADGTRGAPVRNIRLEVREKSRSRRRDRKGRAVPVCTANRAARRNVIHLT